MNACARGGFGSSATKSISGNRGAWGFGSSATKSISGNRPLNRSNSRIRTMLLPSITHFASSHETLSAAEATPAKRKAARILRGPLTGTNFAILPERPLRSFRRTDTSDVAL